MSAFGGFFRKIGAFFTTRRIDLNLILALVVIVLVNVVGQQAYLRVDLTEDNVYSLSPVSENVMGSLEDPMKVKVFFSEDVPATYTPVRRYLTDMLRQYESVGEGRFSYEVFSMTGQDGQQQASEYGVRPIQIREVRADEFQQKQAYMGAAILYGDTIETINQITSTQGLEYRLTTTMQNMVRQVNALAGVQGQVETLVYASQNLSQLQIKGLDSLESDFQSMFQQLNSRSGGKLSFTIQRPTESEVEEVVDRYGMQRLTWRSRESQQQSGQGAQNAGVLGVVLRYQDQFEVVPIDIRQTLLGGYQLEGMESVRTKIENKLSVLVQANPSIAYITGHGEKSLSDARRGAGRLRQLTQGLYQLEELDLSQNPIPADTQTVIINGPRQQFSQWELYQLDQFLMRGGSLMVLADPFQQQRSRRTRRPSYEPIATGLRELLSSYGIEISRSYVMDTEAYVSRQQGRQDVKVHNAPLLADDGLTEESVITRDLTQVLFLNSAAVSYPGAPGSGDGQESGNGTVDYQWLARSSEQSWEMTENITLNPMMIRPPSSGSDMRPYTLAAQAEGRFASHFDEAVEPPEGFGESSQDGGEGADGEQQASQAAGDGAGAGTEGESEGNANADTADVVTRGHLEEATNAGRIIAAGTSEIAGAQLLGQQQQGGQSPNVIMVQNMIDYLNGNLQVPPMRTKGLQVNRLDETVQTTRTLIRLLHVVAVPAAVVLAGLAVWIGRRQYQRRIQEMLQTGGTE